MNNIDESYKNLLKDILENGIEKKDRTGTGTLSVFGRQIRHKMSDGFPLLTTKKMAWKSIVTELLWFLKGDTNIKYLVDNDCHIWDGDAYKEFYQWIHMEWEDGRINELEADGLIKPESQDEKSISYRILTKKEYIDRIKTDDKFAEEYGSLGPIYGKQWRKWKFTDKFTNGQQMAYVNGTVDQIQDLINELKTNPDSRRLMVNAWNVGELSQMVLPPCHYGFQVYTRELSEGERGLLLQPYGLDPLTKEGRDKLWKENNLPTRAISLMWNARSQDVPLGTPFNIASYALLLVILGNMVNMVPDELIGNLGDCHIYLNQINGVKEQLSRNSYELPTLDISSDVNFNGTLDDFLYSCSITDFIIKDYKSHPKIVIPLSN